MTRTCLISHRRSIHGVEAEDRAADPLSSTLRLPKGPKERADVDRAHARIVLVIFLLGGFSGRFDAYGFGHGGVGAIGIILIVTIILMLTGRL